MSLFKHYLITLFFMLCMGGYLIYNLYTLDLTVSLIQQFGLYLLVAHGMLLAGLVWMFFVKLISSAIYKEDFAEFITGISMIAAFAIAIYINLEFSFDNLVEMEMATYIVAVTSIPLGATLGYRVRIDNMESIVENDTK